MARHYATQYANAFASVSSASPGSTGRSGQATETYTYNGSDASKLSNRNDVLYKFAAPAGFQRKKFAGVNSLTIQVSGGTSVNNYINRPFVHAMYIHIIAGNWDPNTVTYNSKPGVTKSGRVFNQANGSYTLGAAELAYYPAGATDNIFKNGIYIEASIIDGQFSYGYPAQATAYVNTNNPSAQFAFDDLIPRVTNPSPASGIIDSSASNNLSWRFEVDSGAEITPKQAGFVVEWRDRTSGEIRRITGEGDSRVTIPENTFPHNEEIQWRVMAVSDDGISSEWTPWCILQPVDRTPIVINAAPQGGFVDDSRANIFSWAFGVLGNPKGPPKQLEYVLEWKSEPDGEIRTIKGGSTSSATIPAATLPFQQAFSWRVRVRSTDDLWSDWTPWYALTTVNTASAAIAISPSGAYLAANEPVRFAWLHASLTGTPQSAWEIEYSQGDEWYPLASGEGNAQTYLLPSAVFAGGTMRWRVRTRNTQGTWGDWSNELENFVIAAPPTPVINEIPADTSRPYVSWQAPEQLTYQLQILDEHGEIVYDTAIQSGAERGHTVAGFLADGQYEFRVRVQSEFGIWSSWGYRVADILMPEIATPIIRCAPIVSGVQVIAGNIPDNAYVLVYRDEGAGFIPIARIEGEGYFNDHTCTLTTCRYFLRSVAGYGVYKDSAHAAARPEIARGYLALADQPGDMVALVLRRGERPKRSRSLSLTATLRNYEGRELPTAEFDAVKRRSHTFTYSFMTRKNLGQYDRLEAMISRREPIIYRDAFGIKIYGVILTLPGEIDRIGEDFTLTIQEVDRQEAIPIA